MEHKTVCNIAYTSAQSSLMGYSVTHYTVFINVRPLTSLYISKDSTFFSLFKHLIVHNNAGICMSVCLSVCNKWLHMSAPL